MINVSKVLIKGGMAALCFCLMTTCQVEAQVSLEPELLVLEIQTDKEFVQEVRVTNEGNKAKEIWIETEYRWQGPCEGQIEEWVEILPAHFQLACGKQQKIKLKFKRKSGRIKGESHFFLYVREELKRAVTLNIKTGIPIFVRFNQGVEPQGEIGNIYKKRASDGTWILEAPVKNTGEMYLLPYGFSWLDDSRGKRVWFKEVRLRQPIPPGQTESVGWQIPAEALVPKGRGNVELFWGTLYGIAQGKINSQKVSFALAE
jgi:P pilus assembly chaperone PapD